MAKEDQAKSNTAVMIAVITGLFALCGTIVTVIGGPIVLKMLENEPTPAVSTAIVITAPPAFTPNQLLASQPPATAASTAIPATIALPCTGLGLYKNTLFGFEVCYPADGKLATSRNDSARVDMPIISGTDLKQNYLEIEAITNRTPCVNSEYLAFPRAYQSTPTVQNFNGIEFLVRRSMADVIGPGQGARSYSTVKGNICVSLTFKWEGITESKYTPPLTMELERIVETFQWITP